ncbi:MAG: bifunctional oligoribonuclease/PAP phosphatase NrnA [Candidatus Gracilibacteria bacterium]|nr:bifunctional oligoribonuclease/PAP phosphatase NrnA [Candidatus Gracilibacteria bacterium]
MKENIIKLGESIKNSNKILLINHIRMDMDSFGSLSAMYDILKQLGKDVKAINDEIPPETFAFTGYNQIIDTNLELKSPLLNKEGVRGWLPDIIISFDAASLDQLGKSYLDNIDVFNNTEFFVIDHHITNPGFGKINIINTKSSSTCELTFDILREINLDKYITPKIATSLLSGIYTDTNIFYNSNTTKNTHIVAGELIELGADFRKPYFEFYMKRTFEKSKLWGEVLANHMKSTENGKIVYACIDKNVFKKTNTDDRQLTGIISEFFANIEGVEICFLSYEMSNKQIKTSFRCTENHDVAKICETFGGGGHKQAAGFNSDKSLNEVEIDIIEILKKELN